METFENGQKLEVVFINSESDLPKEDGIYIVHSRKSNVISLFTSHLNSHIWKSEIDWYLRPLPADLPTGQAGKIDAPRGSKEKIIEILHKYSNKSYCEVGDDLISRKQFESIANELSSLPASDTITIKDWLDLFNERTFDDFEDAFIQGCEVGFQYSNPIPAKPEEIDRKYCTCGNPSGNGNVYFEGDEKLIYNCSDCGKPVNITEDFTDEDADHTITGR